MSILIIGAHGNMGKRYQAILKHLKQYFECVDVHHKPEEIIKMAKDSDGAIIATPTSTHVDLIRSINDLHIPILCEKPISTNLTQLKELFDELNIKRTNLSMVYQYRMLNPGNSGWSYYNYFKHGSDGINWDCIQIVGLAKGAFALEETSPIWKCMINAKTMNIAHMDQAYIEFIEDWLDVPGDDLSELFDIHAKTAEVGAGMSCGEPH